MPDHAFDVEIWPFECEFQNKIFNQFRVLGGIKFANKLLIVSTVDFVCISTKIETVR